MRVQTLSATRKREVYIQNEHLGEAVLSFIRVAVKK